MFRLANGVKLSWCQMWCLRADSTDLGNVLRKFILHISTNIDSSIRAGLGFFLFFFISYVVALSQMCVISVHSKIKV